MSKYILTYMHMPQTYMINVQFFSHVVNIYIMYGCRVKSDVKAGIALHPQDYSSAAGGKRQEIIYCSILWEVKSYRKYYGIP